MGENILNKEFREILMRLMVQFRIDFQNEDPQNRDQLATDYEAKVAESIVWFRHNVSELFKASVDPSVSPNQQDLKAETNFAIQKAAKTIHRLFDMYDVNMPNSDEKTILSALADVSNCSYDQGHWEGMQSDGKEILKSATKEHLEWLLKNRRDFFETFILSKGFDRVPAAPFVSGKKERLGATLGRVRQGLGYLRDYYLGSDPNSVYGQHVANVLTLLDTPANQLIGTVTVNVSEDANLAALGVETLAKQLDGQLPRQGKPVPVAKTQGACLADEISKAKEILLNAIDKFRVGKRTEATTRDLSDMHAAFEILEHGRQPIKGNVLHAEGYEPLGNVLSGAFDQASVGKGRDRHANGKPFTEQPIFKLADSFGTGFLLGQAAKKLEESQGLDLVMARAEIYGAIVYSSAALLHREMAEGARTDTDEEEEDFI